MATPWIPTGFDEYPLVSIESIPASQIQFRRNISATDDFGDGDCDVFGREGYLIGIKMCVAASKTLPGSIIAGTYTKFPNENWGV